MRESGAGMGGKVVGGWERRVERVECPVTVTPAEECVRERMSKEEKKGRGEKSGFVQGQGSNYYVSRREARTKKDCRLVGNWKVETARIRSGGGIPLEGESATLSTEGT